MIKELRHFIAVIDGGNISTAAERLGITQPALSKSIRRLELDLGLTLLERGPRGVKATEDGNRIYARARKIDTELRYLDLDAGSLRDPSNRFIRVGASPLWEIIAIPDIVCALQKRFPDVTISLTIDQKDRLVDMLAAGTIDFAICGIDVARSESDIDCVKVADVELRIACSKTHPLAKGWSGDPEEIYGQNWVDYRWALERIRADFKADITPGSVLESSSWLSGLLTAAKGNYLVTLPYQLAEFAEQFGLVFVPNLPPAARFSAGIWYRKSIESTAIGRAFLSISQALIESGAVAPKVK